LSGFVKTFFNAVAVHSIGAPGYNGLEWDHGAKER
jgi:hypothetical protein